MDKTQSLSIKRLYKSEIILNVDQTIDEKREQNPDATNLEDEMKSEDKKIENELKQEEKNSSMDSTRSLNIKRFFKKDVSVSFDQTIDKKREDEQNPDMTNFEDQMKSEDEKIENELIQKEKYSCMDSTRSLNIKRFFKKEISVSIDQTIDKREDEQNSGFTKIDQIKSRDQKTEADPKQEKHPGMGSTQSLNIKRFPNSEISARIGDVINKSSEKEIQKYPLYLTNQNYNQAIKFHPIHNFWKFVMTCFTSHPKTSSPVWLPIETLIYESRFNPTYKKNIRKLKEKFLAWRKIRGDGNCYYRAVLVGYLLNIYHYSSEPTHIENFLNKLRVVQDSNPNLQYINYLLGTLQGLETTDSAEKVQTYIKIENLLQDPGFDRSLIEAGRLLAELQIEKSRKTLLEFIEESFFPGLVSNIRTWGNEAESFELLLLPLALGITVKQMNLYENVAENDFPHLENDMNRLIIPIISKCRGHYDLLLSIPDMEKQEYIVNEGVFLIPN